MSGDGCLTSEGGQLDHVDGLDLTVLDNNWCEGCRKLQRELDKVQTEHAANFKMLKEKIIPTDELLRRYGSKCQEYEAQTKKLEDINCKLEKAQRNCDLMASQLKVSLEETEPLRKAKERSEKRKEEYKQQLETLQDRVKALENTNHQMAEAQKHQDKDWDKAQAQLEEVRAQVKNLEVTVKRKDSMIKKLQDDVVNKKSGVVDQKKKYSRLVAENSRLKKKLAKCQDVMQGNGLGHEVSSVKRGASRHSSVVSHNLSEDWASDTSGSESDDLDMVFEEMGVFARDKIMPISPAVSPLPPSPAPPRRRLNSDTMGDDNLEDTGSGDSSESESTDELADLLENQFADSSPRRSPRLAHKSPPHGDCVPRVPLRDRRVEQLRGTYRKGHGKDIHGLYRGHSLQRQDSIDIQDSTYDSRDIEEDTQDRLDNIDSDKASPQITDQVLLLQQGSVSLTDEEDADILEESCDSKPEQFQALNQNLPFQNFVSPEEDLANPFDNSDNRTDSAFDNFHGDSIDDKTEQVTEDNDDDGVVSQLPDDNTDNVDTVDMLDDITDNSTTNVDSGTRPPDPQNVNTNLQDLANTPSGAIAKSTELTDESVAPSAVVDTSIALDTCATLDTGAAVDKSAINTGAALDTGVAIDTSAVLGTGDAEFSQANALADKVTKSPCPEDQTVDPLSCEHNKSIKSDINDTDNGTKITTVSLVSSNEADGEKVEASHADIIEPDGTTICLSDEKRSKVDNIDDKDISVHVDTSDSFGLSDIEPKTSVQDIVSDGSEDTSGSGSHGNKQDNLVASKVNRKVGLHRATHVPCERVTRSKSVPSGVPVDSLIAMQSDVTARQTRRSSQTNVSSKQSPARTVSKNNTPRPSPKGAKRIHESKVDTKVNAKRLRSDSESSDEPVPAGCRKSPRTRRLSTPNVESPSLDTGTLSMDTSEAVSPEHNAVESVPCDKVQEQVNMVLDTNSPANGLKEHEVATDSGKNEPDLNCDSRDSEVVQPDLSKAKNVDNSASTLEDVELNSDHLKDVSDKPESKHSSNSKEAVLSGNEPVRQQSKARDDMLPHQISTEFEVTSCEEHTDREHGERKLKNVYPVQPVLKTFDMMSEEICTSAEKTKQDKTHVPEELHAEVTKQDKTHAPEGPSAKVIKDKIHVPEEPQVEVPDVHVGSCGLPYQTSMGFNVGGEIAKVLPNTWNSVTHKQHKYQNKSPGYLSEQVKFVPITEHEHRKALQNRRKSSGEGSQHASHETNFMPIIEHEEIKSPEALDVKFYISSSTASVNSDNMTDSSTPNSRSTTPSASQSSRSTSPQTPMEDEPPLPFSQQDNLISETEPRPVGAFHVDEVDESRPRSRSGSATRSRSVTPSYLPYVDDLPSPVSPLSACGSDNDVDMADVDLVEDTEVPEPPSDAIQPRKRRAKSDSIEKTAVPGTSVDNAKKVPGAQGPTLPKSVANDIIDALDSCPPMKKKMKGHKVKASAGGATSRYVIPNRRPLLARQKKLLEKDLELLIRMDTVTVSHTVASLTGQRISAEAIVDAIVQLLQHTTSLEINSWAQRCVERESAAKQGSQEASHIGHDTPWLSPTLKTLLELLASLSKQPDMEDIQDYFINSCIRALKTKDDLPVQPVSGKVAVCQGLTAVCRLQKNIERVRVFAFDCVCGKYDSYPSLLVAIASTWPIAISKPMEGQAAAILEVLEYIVLKRTLSHTKEKHKGCLVVLKLLLHWTVPEYDDKVLAKRILGKLHQSALDVKQASDCERAVELLCCIQTWSWKNNFLITEQLWPTFQQWAVTKAGVNKPSDAHIQSLIRILGRVTFQCPAEYKDAAHNSIKTLSAVLLNDAVSVAIQMATLSSLMLLAPFNPQEASDAIKAWLCSPNKAKTLHEHPQIASDAQTFLDVIKPKVPSLSGIEIPEDTS